MLDHLPCGGILTETLRRKPDLFESLVPVGQIHRRDRAQIVKLRSVPGQDGTPAQPLESAQRFQIISQVSVLIVNDGGAAAEDGIGG